MEQPLVASIFEKVNEQIDLVCRLTNLAAANLALDWIPPLPGAEPLGWLLNHLADCIAGFCAVLAAAYPEPLASLAALKQAPPPPATSAEEALEQIALYRLRMNEAAVYLTDADLSRKIPTIFARDGRTAMLLLLGNLEHLISHKCQLFTYVKLAGIPVSSQDLYVFDTYATVKKQPYP